MPQYYNLTNVTNSSNLWELTSSVNSMTNSWYGVAVLITFTIIMFISMKDYPLKESFAATMFVGSVMAILFRLLGLINDLVMVIFVILAAISIINLLFNK